jgi:hypothetical protein
MKGVRMARDFKEYLDTEISEMLREVEKVCPVDSPCFNDVAMAWVARNAAQFRSRWDRFEIPEGSNLPSN